MNKGTTDGNKELKMNSINHLEFSPTVEYNSRYELEDEEPSVGNEGDDEDEDDVDEPSLSLDIDTLSDLTGDLLARQKLNNIQARFKNFEEILVHLRCQINEMHKRDNDIIKRIATLNDELAELNLIESYESARAAAAENFENGDY